MSDDTGWRPLRPPRRPAVPDADGDRPSPSLGPSPFVRLARVHAMSAAGDAMIAIALAGSLFFSIDPAAARSRVLLYLLLTMAPFAIVGPLIGPALDRARGGRRAMVIAINLLRAVFAFFMIGNVDSLLLFPLAFGILVLGKSYAVAKAAIVPTTVKSEQELVERNSRLALLSGISGFVAAIPALAAGWLGGASWVVGMAMIVFLVGFVLSFRIPRTAIAAAPADADERQELRSQGILLAASATGALRGIIGFMTLMIAFAFRGGADDVDLSGTGTAFGAGVHHQLVGGVDTDTTSPPLILGVIAGASVIGMLCGSLIAPRARKTTPEENILLGSLVLMVVFGVFSTWLGGVLGGLTIAFMVGVGASAGKLAFDSIVQRDAPDANYGRSFARFETRFQVIWVIGALIPVAIAIPARLGYLIIAASAAFAALSYFFGSRGRPIKPPRRRRRTPPDPQPAPEAAKAVPPSVPLFDGETEPESETAPSNQLSLWDDHR